MIRHVVVLTFTSDTSPESIDHIIEGLGQLPSLVPSLRGYRIDRDLDIDPNSGDLVITADFDDVAGYEAYRDNPDHQRVISERIRPALAGRGAVQIEV